MSRLLFAGSALAALLMTARAAHAQNQTTIAGLNMGAPVWEGKVALEALDAAIATGAPYIRVNFRIDRWTSPNDEFFAAYDQIVHRITDEGLEVYGLISDELVKGLGPKDAGFDEAWVKNALLVIDRYKDRVRVWETINEPNNWDESQTARMSATDFARAHARLYEETKVKHASDGCWSGLSLVTGPLFSFDGVTSTDYLEQAIVSGRAGGAWKSVRDAIGRDPIDGVGYHIYVAQGADSSNDNAVTEVNKNLDALRALLDREGLGDQKVWLSEIGYRASLLGDQGQAERLDATFQAIAGRSDVASTQWFTVADFGGDETWGLFGNSFAEKRTSHTRFVASARTFAPALAARLEVELPKAVAPGARVVAKVRATNLGKTAWTPGDNIRLGAASGCPSAWAMNEWTWDASDTSAGYATSVVDARRFLPNGVTVQQGDSVTFDVPLTAPTSTGKARFAARMVHEGVAWFGSTAIAEVTIGDGPATDGTPSDEPSANGKDAKDKGSSRALKNADASSGCGCHLPRTAIDNPYRLVALFAMTVSVLRLRRRR